MVSSSVDTVGTVAVPGWRPTEATSAARLLTAYDKDMARMPVTASAVDKRRQAAAEFLSHHPDLGAWMLRPTTARLVDLKRTRGWPFLSWCILTGRVDPDLELLLAKPAGVGLPTEWAGHHHAEVTRLARAGQDLGWSSNWVRQVTHLAACTLCLWVGKTPSELDDADFLLAAAEVSTLAGVSDSARRHARRRLSRWRRSATNWVS